MSPKLNRPVAGLLLVLAAGCQNTIATQGTTRTVTTPTVQTSAQPSAAASVAPVAIQGTTAVTGALTQAAANASGNPTAAAIISSTSALLNLPAAFLNAFNTSGFHAASTNLTRSTTYAGQNYTVTYNSDDNFNPLASWSVAVNGGPFSSSTTVLTGHISQDGKTGDWTWAANQLSSQPFTVNWTTDASNTLTVNYTLSGQNQCTIIIQASAHGSYTCNGQSGTF